MPSKALRVVGVDAVLYTPAKFHDEPTNGLPVIFDETTGTAWKPDVELPKDSTVTLTIEEFLRQRSSQGEQKDAKPAAGGKSQRQKELEEEEAAKPKPKFPFIIYITRESEIADAFPRQYIRPTDEATINRGLLHLIADQSHYYLLNQEVRRAAYMLASNFVVLAVAYEDIVARDRQEDAKYRATPPARRKQLRSTINIMLDAMLRYFKKDGDKIDEERILLCSGPTGKSNWQLAWMSAIQNPGRLAGIVPVTGSTSALAHASDEDDQDERGFVYWERTVQLTAPELEHVGVNIIVLGDPNQSAEETEAEDGFPGIFSISSFALSTISVQMAASLKTSGNKKFTEMKVPIAKTQRERYEEKANPYASVELVKSLLAHRRRKRTVVKL